MTSFELEVYLLSSGYQSISEFCSSLKVGYGQMIETLKLRRLDSNCLQALNQIGITQDMLPVNRVTLTDSERENARQTIKNILEELD